MSTWRDWFIQNCTNWRKNCAQKEFNIGAALNIDKHFIPFLKEKCVFNKFKKIFLKKLYLEIKNFLIRKSFDSQKKIRTR